MKTIIIALSVFAFLAVPAHAQIVSGSIVGSLKDPSGGAIPGADISARNEATELERKTVSDSDGNFSLATLPPGKWSVTASHAGFKSATVSHVELVIDQTARVDMTLQVGQITETVNVQAAATTLETETPTIGQVIVGRPVSELPLNGRNFIQLATLSAGVAPATSTSSESSRLGRTQITAHVAGSRGSYNSYLIDGMESRGARFGELPILPSVDAVQEFKIQRNYYSAEYGGNTGIISLSIKSGANQFHGTIYDFLRNSEFDARQFFDGPGPSPLKLNQFGFSFGGPIRRDKTFFFANYEGRRQRRSTTQFATLPSPAQLAGDFSAVATRITDPLNGNAQFAGNVIPPNRISKFAQGYRAYIPAPNTNLTQGNYVGTVSSADDFDQVNFRVDHRFSLADSMFARYSQSNWDVTQPGLLPYRGLAFPLNGQNAVVEETHIFNSSSVNTVKAGFSRSFLASALIGASQDLATQLGLQNLAVLSYDYSLPNVGINGFSAFGYAGNTFRHYTNDYAISDTLALTRGRHNLSLGFDLRETRTPTIGTNASNGGFTFTNRFTGLPLADFLLGSYTTATAQLFRSERDYRFNQYAAFVQDNWRVSNRLTLNLGVRYEFQQPWHDKSGSEGFFDPSIPGLRLARDPKSFGFNIAAPWIVIGGVREGVVKPDYKNFAPRVGLAWRATNKTVLRSGYGIFYAMPQGNDSGSISQNPGAAVSASYTNSPGTTPRLIDTLFDTAVASLTGASTQLLPADPNRHTAYMQQWSFNVERELDSSTVVEIGYVGSKGTHLMERQDINQAVLNAPGQNLPVQVRRPYSQFQSILLFEGNEISNYHALTVRAERRLAVGFSYLVNFTWAKSLDTSSRSIDDGGSAHNNALDTRADYGLSAFDIRKRLTSSTLWDLPFGKGKPFAAHLSPVADHLVSGWQLNTILQLQMGNPFSVTVPGDQPNVGGTFNVERPNRIGRGILPKDQRTPARWFDTSAFQINALNTFGNAGRDILFQDGVRTFDVSLFKNNFFGERNYNLQLRAEFFNILNNVNFARPGNSISGANFGVVTAAGNAREIQLALKFIF